MKRSPMPKRKGPMATRVKKLGASRIAKRRRKRVASEFARIYGSRARVAFVKQLACIIGGCLQYPCENAHVVNINGGVGRKSDAAAIAPLCHAHHGELHRIGAQSFAARYLVNLAAEAERVVRAWAAQLAREAA